MTKTERKHYRIVFPVGETAVFRVKKIDYRIRDLSESGVSIMSEWTIATGTAIRGTIILPQGETNDVAGIVKRISDAGDACVEFQRGVPFKVVMDEQLRLIKKYGSL